MLCQKYEQNLWNPHNVAEKSKRREKTSAPFFVLLYNIREKPEFFYIIGITQVEYHEGVVPGSSNNLFENTRRDF